MPDDVINCWTDRRYRLSIELLETIYFDDRRESPLITTNLHRLREIEVEILTDDFGSGRASITGLLKVRPNRLKIERNLIRAAMSDPRQRKVAAAIVEMTRALKRWPKASKPPMASRSCVASVAGFIRAIC